MRTLCTFATLAIPLLFLGFVASADDGDDVDNGGLAGQPKRDGPADELTSVTVGAPRSAKGLVMHEMSHEVVFTSNRERFENPVKSRTRVFLGDPDEDGRAAAVFETAAGGLRAGQVSLPNDYGLSSRWYGQVVQWAIGREFEVGEAVPVDPADLPDPAWQDHIISWDGTYELLSIEESTVLGDRFDIATFELSISEAELGERFDWDDFTWLQGSATVMLDIESWRPLYVHTAGAQYAPMHMEAADVVQSGSEIYMFRYEHYDDEELAAFIEENEIEDLDEFLASEEDD